jgi:hypothetical protein
MRESAMATASVLIDGVQLGAVCLLPAACCLLPAACCLLPAACCLLPAACCLLPAACCPCPQPTTHTHMMNAHRIQMSDSGLTSS